MKTICTRKCERARARVVCQWHIERGGFQARCINVGACNIIEIYFDKISLRRVPFFSSRFTHKTGHRKKKKTRISFCSVRVSKSRKRTRHYALHTLIRRRFAIDVRDLICSHYDVHSSVVFIGIAEIERPTDRTLPERFGLYIVYAVHPPSPYEGHGAFQSYFPIRGGEGAFTWRIERFFSFSINNSRVFPIIRASIDFRLPNKVKGGLKYMSVRKTKIRLLPYLYIVRHQTPLFESILSRHTRAR